MSGGCQARVESMQPTLQKRSVVAWSRNDLLFFHCFGKLSDVDFTWFSPGVPRAGQWLKPGRACDKNIKIGYHSE